MPRATNLWDMKKDKSINMHQTVEVFGINAAKSGKEWNISRFFVYLVYLVYYCSRPGHALRKKAG